MPPMIELPEPHCRAEHLGLPMPDSPHAVSVSLPLWQHNVGYEEGDPNIILRMQSGYPRFFINPIIDRFHKVCEQLHARNGAQCLAFPNRRVAERCRDFVRRQADTAVGVDSYGADTGVHVVTIPADAYKVARQFWQHAGENISSRAAELLLNQLPASIGNTSAKQKIRHRVAEWSGARADDVFLFPSGMAAISAACRVAARLRPDAACTQFGFPYVDTLKLLEKFAPSKANAQFFPQGDAEELDRLERNGVASAGMFCEFPSNPLLTSPDLSRLASVSRRQGIPLIADDTLSALINADVLPVVDAVTTSLTKFFSGAGDVIAGCLTLNAASPLYPALRNGIEQEYDDLFYDADAEVLESNSRDAEDRVRRINATAETLCDSLSAHPLVKRVHFPKYVTPDTWNAFRKPNGGYGGLFSIDLHDPAATAPAMFDALQISKGPNLGTNFSLCCPFTILAHYQELDFAESCGVSRYLLRVSVGLEDGDWLIERFRRALESAEARR